MAVTNEAGGSRAEAAQRKERAAFWSIIASAALTLGKLGAGLMSGSLALISEAGHALLDTGATIVTWFAVREAEKPADEEHHYGHGKIESVAALIETGLLFVLAAGVLWEAGKRLWAGGGEVEANWIVFAVLGASIIIDLTRWRALTRIAQETHSDALAADALHFSSDLASSVLVAAGLAATAFGFHAGDALAAIGVALFIGIAGYRLGKRTIDTLIDAAPKDMGAELRLLLEGVPGIVEVCELRLRRVGPLVLGETRLAVARTLPLDRVMRIKNDALAAIAARWPEAQITVTTEPRALDDETILERVMLIAARRHVFVHHVTVQMLGERLSLSMDVEVDGHASIGSAHALASGLEDALREEFGPLTEVETHIEPLEGMELAGEDAPAELRARIAESLKTRAAGNAVVGDIHSVRVRQNAKGCVVNYHCRVDPALDVLTVHQAVDDIERRVRLDHPEIARVVGHTEPRSRITDQPAPSLP
jgi:cation diffusion facilitator family transporter